MFISVILDVVDDADDDLFNGVAEEDSHQVEEEDEKDGEEKAQSPANLAETDQSPNNEDTQNKKGQVHKETEEPAEALRQFRGVAGGRADRREMETRVLEEGVPGGLQFSQVDRLVTTQVVGHEIEEAGNRGTPESID